MTRPEPPAGARSLVIVVLDSLRHDAWLEAAPGNLGQLGPVERRYSYASWTAPSHYALLMGLVPHTSPRGVYASDFYKRDFERHAERLGVPGLDFKSLLPSLWLPGYLRDQLGYRTHARVSMPVLNPHTTINRDFDTYELMPAHNDLGAMVAALDVQPDAPSFHLLNTGETHYPYVLPGEDPTRWPRLHGIHGAIEHLGDKPPVPAPEAFDAASLNELRARQVETVTHVDTAFGTLFDRLPSGTWVIVTSDHGELFGEDGYFGHGPIAHEKVLEVPFAEGAVP